MPLNLPCDWKSGFVMDPIKKQRFGYLTAFNGIGLSAELAQDITVYCPYNNATAPAYTPVAPANGQVKCVGILENISWGQAVGDAFTISCYMSSENANLLKALKAMTLKTTSVSKVGWWVANFDEVSKAWFEEHYPKAPVNPTGQINAQGKNDIRIHIADEGVKVAPNIDILVYNVYFEIIPAANQTCTFLVASSSTKNTVLPWGLVVGTLPTQAVPAGT